MLNLLVEKWLWLVCIWNYILFCFVCYFYIMFFSFKKKTLWLYTVLCQLQHQGHLSWDKNCDLSYSKTFFILKWSWRFFKKKQYSRSSRYMEIWGPLHSTDGSLLKFVIDCCVGGNENRAVFIFIHFEGNHLRHWHYRFARSNLSQQGGSGHIPPWRFLFLSSDLKLISLWSPYALAKSSKLPPGK